MEVTDADLLRFWDKVYLTSNCWFWKASVKDTGYGQFSFKGKPKKAHQWFHLVAGGEPSPVVRHRCDNRLCIRPSHLLSGTHKDNVDDMHARGRYVNGQSIKTHCPNNHPYEGDNLYVRPDGGRGCRTCRTVATNKYKKGK